MKIKYLLLLSLTISLDHLLGDSSGVSAGESIDEKASSKKKTIIGGHGELQFTYRENGNGKREQQSIDFHHFVLYFAHSFNDKWSFKAALGIEHGFVNFDEGELVLGEAYIDYHPYEFLGFQAGVLLAPVGYLNENHEPTLYHSVERSPYNRAIIPTEWFANGFAIYGSIKGFQYKVQIMEGLIGENISTSSGIEEARTRGFFDFLLDENGNSANALSPTFVAKLNYQGFKGLNFGSSMVYNKAISTNGPGDRADIDLVLSEAHLVYHDHHLYVTGEIGYIRYWGHEELEGSFGYYLELGYNLGGHLKSRWEWILWTRWGSHNTAFQVKDDPDEDVVEIERQNQRDRFDLGLHVKPIPHISLKLQYATEFAGRDYSNDGQTHYVEAGLAYEF